MRGIELACAAIVALYLALRLGAAADRKAVAARLGLLAVASFLAEDSVRELRTEMMLQIVNAFCNG